MKKFIRFIFAISVVAITLFVFSSCETTTQTQSPKNTNDAQNVQLEDMKIAVLSSPKECVRGKPFSAPYKIQVTNKTGTPYPSLSVIAEYPSSRTKDSVSFAQEILVTDENGCATFSPQNPQFAIKSQVSFYPQSPSSAPAIVKLCSEITATSPWIVRTNASARTGILVSIVDYNQDGKMTNAGGAQFSTQALEKVLWKRGLTGAQNADFRHSVDADEPTRIRNDAVKLVSGNTNFIYVIYGRVKYASKVVKDADGFFNVTLNGDMGILNIKTGEVLVKTVKTVTVKEKTEWKLLSLAQEEMAKLFGEEVIYGL